jgi:hypothetical protein
MQFALEVAVLECSFLNHNQEILGVSPFLVDEIVKILGMVLLFLG